VALAGALVHDPSLIILDEPLTGLDAGSARQVKSVLRERVAQGGTVIMTTHILEVAERMADRIGVIAAGRLIAQGTLAELRDQAGRGATSLEDTFLALVAEQAAAAWLTPGTLVRFARHESRLAWRDWLAMMTAGGRWRTRSVALTCLIVLVSMHLLALSVVGRYAGISDPDKETLVTITGCVLMSWSLMVSQALESVTRAFYTRADLDPSCPLDCGPQSLRGYAARRSRSRHGLAAAAPAINVLAARTTRGPPMAQSRALRAARRRALALGRRSA
jgi:hypothetical protein